MSEPGEFIQLVQAARSGCREAGEALVRVYGEHIRRVSRRYVRKCGLHDELEADDLAQSAWRMVLCEPSGLGWLEPVQVLQYLSQIVAHKAIDALRRKAVRKRYLRWLEAHLRGAQPHRVRSADPSAAAEWSDHLAAAYDRLSDEERMICAWRRAGRTWRQVGDAMNQRPQAVQKRFDRAMARIRREILRDAPGR